MDHSILFSKTKRKKDEILSLLKNNMAKQKNIAGAIIGGLLGASSQEDNGNEILSMPVATIIGAMTGLALDFDTPIVARTIDPEKAGIKYSTAELKRDNTPNNLKVNMFIDKLGNKYQTIDNLSNDILALGVRNYSINDEIDALQLERENLSMDRDLLSLPKAETEDTKSLRVKIRDHEERLSNKREKLETLRRQQEKDNSKNNGKRTKTMDDRTRMIKTLKDEIRKGAKNISLMYKGLPEFNVTEEGKEEIARMESRISEIENRIGTLNEERFGNNKRLERKGIRLDRVSEHAGLQYDAFNNVVSSIIDNGSPESSSLLSSIVADVDSTANGATIAPVERLEKIREGLSNATDTKAANQILNTMSMKLHNFQTLGQTPGGKSITDRGTIRKSEISKRASKNSEVVINALSTETDKGNLVNDIFKSNNTPLDRQDALRQSMEKMFDEATAKGHSVKVTQDSMAMYAGNKKLMDIKFTKYGDNGEKFVRSSTGTMTPVKGFNPFSSMLAQGKEFDFSQIGEAAQSDGSHIRVPTAGDIVKSYDTTDALHFFGVNNHAAEMANSLQEYVAAEHIGRIGNDRTYKTGLGKTIGRSIELKYTLNPKAVDESGRIIESEKRISQLSEVPKRGQPAEMTKVIEALSREYKESMPYGQTHTSRKTMITNPNSQMDQLISPVPNAARAGQGTMNRGTIAPGRENASPSVSSARTLKKKILTGKNTIAAVPYLLGTQKAFGDGQNLYVRGTKDLFGEELGRLEIAATGEGFNVNIDKIEAFKAALKIRDDVERQKFISEYRGNTDPSYRAEVENLLKRAEDQNNPVIMDRATRMDNGMSNKGIQLISGDTIGYTPTGTPARIPEYFSRADIIDAKINTDGNLDIQYKGTYNPELADNRIKVYSQSTKAVLEGINKEDAAMLSFFDTLESHGLIDYKKRENGGLYAIEIGTDAKTREIGGQSFNSLIELLEVEGGLDKGSIGDTGRILLREGSSETKTFGDKTLLLGSDRFKRYMALPGSDFIQKFGGDGMIVPLSESGFEDLFGYDKATSIEDVSERATKFLKNYGVDSFDTLHHPSDAEPVSDRIAKRAYDFEATGQGMDPLEYSKREALSESMYRMYTSENKSAPDIHTQLKQMESEGLLPEIKVDGRTVSIQEIADEKLMLHKDKDVRLQAMRGVREVIRTVGFSEDVFSPTGLMANSVSEVATELGAERVGAGNKSRLSWIAVGQLKNSGVTAEMLAKITDVDHEAVHEYEMIRNTATTPATDAIDATKIQKRHILAINSALSLEPEKRVDALRKIFIDHNFDESRGMVTFAFPEDSGTGIKSLHFSTVTTGRSNVFNTGEIDILSEMDKTKSSILTSFVQMNDAPENSKLRGMYKTDLNVAVSNYKENISTALTTEGNGNIGKRANAVIGKFSEIRGARPVGGYVSNVIIPKLREESGVTGAYNAYTKDQYEEIFAKFGLDSNEDMRLVELFPDELETSKGRTPMMGEVWRPKVFRLERMYEDGVSRPVLELQTREPAQGPMSSMLKEVLVTDELSGIAPGKRSLTVGIPITDEEKYIESFNQKMDFDNDHVGNILVSLESAEDQDKFIAQKAAVDAFVEENKDWLSAMGVKGKNKHVISVDEMNAIAEEKGVSPNMVWALEETSLARKGVLRKTATPLVTSLRLSMEDSINYSLMSGDVDFKQSMMARAVAYDISENILKTQHAETAKAVAPVPEIFRAMEMRKQFMAGNASPASYSDSLMKVVRGYTEPDPSKSTPEMMKKYEMAIEALVSSDKKYSVVANTEMKNVMAINRVVGERGRADPNFFQNLSETMTDVSIKGGEGSSMLPVEIRIPEQTVDAPPFEEVRSAAKKANSTTKDVLLSLTKRKNLRKIGLGTAGVVATTIVLGRNASTPASTDLGQDADRSSTPPVPTTNSAYMASEKVGSSSVKISGLETGVPKQRLERMIYGDSLVSNRVRDQRG